MTTNHNNDNTYDNNHDNNAINSDSKDDDTNSNTTKHISGIDNSDATNHITHDNNSVPDSLEPRDASSPRRGRRADSCPMFVSFSRDADVNTTHFRVGVRVGVRSGFPSGCGISAASLYTIIYV